MPRLDAIDLSHWNTITGSFADIKAAGVIGVMHKASEGTTYVDPNYAPRMQQALAAGLRWGAYHFLKHGNVEAQMAYFLKAAHLGLGSRVAIDYEDAGCTLDDLRGAVTALRKLDPSMEITVYAGALLKEQLGKAVDPLLATTSLWLAQYTAGTPSWPSGTWPSWSLWQYSDGNAGGSPKGVTGVKAPVDCNTFNGSPENCAKWFGPTTAPVPSPTPEPKPPAPAPEPVPAAKVGLTVASGTIVTINGKDFLAP